MSKEFSFSVMPTVNISRSRFVRKSQHKTSLYHGEIVPIYVDEVLPGDTRSFDMASLIRMSTPIAPLMDNIYIDFYAFFVPNRLVWDHWKDFMGENRVSAGIPSQSYSIPMLKIDGKLEGGTYITAQKCAVKEGKLGDYFGLQAITNNYSSTGAADAYIEVSALPFRGYYLIWNEWFRNQNVQAPQAVQTGDTGEALIGTGASINEYNVLPAAKLADYFTKSLPYAQKGQAVSIPLGTTAPVIADPNGVNNSFTAEGKKFIRGEWINVTGSDLGIDTVKLDDEGTSGYGNVLVSDEYNGLQQDSYEHPALREGFAVADLRNATAATINQLRYAFQLQKLFEKDALYGSRYWEILASHFGVTAPDASLQRPEYLGGFRQRINVDQVLSTAGYQAGTSTTVGAPGANSVTASKGSLFTKSFVEHGYIFVMAVTRHDQTYSNTVNRMWSRKDRYDFYFPVFANLGAQTVLEKEVDAKIRIQGSGTGALDMKADDVFGYQEAWAEYRYKPSLVTGLLNPNQENSLDFWTLARKANPADVTDLSSDFIEENIDSLSRALVTGVTGPDYIADFYFEDVAVRPMPTYSIPGLIDHH